MKKRFTEEQIVAILRDGQVGSKTVEQLCREHGVSQPTYYAWKRKYGSMGEPDVKRLRELEKENARLKRLLAERELAMAESTAYERLPSLETKVCIKIIASERNGQRLRLNLPEEIPGIIPAPVSQTATSIEDLDFFGVPENRAAILAREHQRCFYCLRTLNGDDYVIEHVLSRPEGNNGYRNVVAACRHCNNRKNDSSVEDFLRTLYRENFLNDSELEDRLSHLERLRKGELKPELGNRPA